jgi:exopolysaccharide production protein ExoY
MFRSTNNRLKPSPQNSAQLDAFYQRFISAMFPYLRGRSISKSILVNDLKLIVVNGPMIVRERLKQNVGFSYIIVNFVNNVRVSENIMLQMREEYNASIGAGLAWRRRNQIVTRIGIRAFDIIASLVAIIFFAPIMAIIAIAILIFDKGPIFFAHKRIGKCARLFSCWKFRSMVVDADRKLETLLANDPSARAEWDAEQKLCRDPRVTRIGNFLRKTSLDELPQLINVLLGDMSLVGPRPIVVDEIPKYGRYFGEYCRVRPGITGLWQVRGRSEVEYRKRIALDISYIRSPRMRSNLIILALTVPSVLMSRGAR